MWFIIWVEFEHRVLPIKLVISLCVDFLEWFSADSLDRILWVLKLEITALGLISGTTCAAGILMGDMFFGLPSAVLLPTAEFNDS